MRILVYPHLMEIGGSQLNALELADGVAKAGHDVTVFAPDGALYPLAESMRFELIRAQSSNRWPSVRNIEALQTLTKQRYFDVLHGYEWGPSVDICLGPHRTKHTPMVTTVLSMDVPEFLPRHEPMIVGTAELFAEQQRFRQRPYLMEPPIDTDANAPGDGAAQARQRFGFEQTDLVVAVICRLSTDLEKLQGVLQAITTIDNLSADYSVRLLIVGDGDGLAEVRQAAAATNARHSRALIVVTGRMVDPSAGYRASDIVIGMGSSALKGMAFAKPVVVQGTAGFWKVAEPATMPEFLVNGWFGHCGRGAIDLRECLEPLLQSLGARKSLGTLGRELVVSKFSLAHAVKNLISIYEESVARRPSLPMISHEVRRTAYEVAKYKAVIASKHGRERIPQWVRHDRRRRTNAA